jgi:hypothetical protein
MLYRAKFNVCPKIHTRHTNTNGQNVECLMLKLAVHTANARILAEVIFKVWLDFGSELTRRVNNCVRRVDLLHVEAL